MQTTQLRKNLSLVLARLAEREPSRAVVTGMFSGPSDGQLLFGLWAAGEKKLDERLKVTPAAYYRMTLPQFHREFHEQHGCRVAFVMEWFILPAAWAMGSASLVDLMAKQVEEEAVLHEGPPDDPLDTEVTTHFLGLLEGQV